MGTDFLRSFGDASKRRHDNAYIDSQYDALYRDQTSKYYLIYSMSDVLEAVLKRVWDVMCMKTQMPAIDIEKAELITKGDDTKAEDYLRALILNPGNLKYYVQYLEEGGMVDNGDWDAFLDYWNILDLYIEFADYKTMSALDIARQYIENSNQEDSTIKELESDDNINLKHVEEKSINQLDEDNVDIQQNKAIDNEHVSFGSNYDTSSLMEVLKSIDFNSVYSVSGNPIGSDSKKLTKAQAYFGIPVTENVYMIYDSTVLGSCKNGFALCETGFYSCLKERKYIPWVDFREVSIYEDGFLCIGSDRFNVGNKKDLTYMLDMFAKVQNTLKD